MSAGRGPTTGHRRRAGAVFLHTSKRSPVAINPLLDLPGGLEDGRRELFVAHVHVEQRRGLGQRQALDVLGLACFFFSGRGSAGGGEFFFLLLAARSFPLSLPFAPCQVRDSEREARERSALP